MADNPIITLVDDAGYSIHGSKTLSLSVANPSVVKVGSGRLCRVLVTATGTGAITFYDNATTGSGTVLGAVPASPAVGAVFEFQAPAANGITAISGATPSTVTVVYS